MMNELGELKKALEAILLGSKGFVVMSFFVAFFTALIRIARDGTEKQCARRLQEAAICGSITLTLSVGLQAILLYLDTPPEKLSSLVYCSSIFIGGAVGNLGSDFVRRFARKVAMERSK